MHAILFNQINNQLQIYLKRVEAVLGEGWEDHIEGQKLKQDGDTFRLKLNTQELYMYENWKKKVESQQPVVHGNIFKMVSSRTCSGIISKPQVNFVPEAITFAKEVWICCKYGHSVAAVQEI